MMDGVEVIKLYRRYPWDVWLDGQTREFDTRAEFNVSPDSFRAALHSKAHRLRKQGHNVWVSTSLRLGDEGVVEFQFTTLEES